jgi:hypothetical protein
MSSHAGEVECLRVCRSDYSEQILVDRVDTTTSSIFIADCVAERVKLMLLPQLALTPTVD